MSLIQNATQQPGIVNADEYHYHAQHSPMIASFSSSFPERGPSRLSRLLARLPTCLPVCLLYTIAPIGTLPSNYFQDLLYTGLSWQYVHADLQHRTGSRQAAGDKNRLMQATTGLVGDIKRESLSKSTSITGNHRESVYPPSLALVFSQCRCRCQVVFA